MNRYFKSLQAKECSFLSIQCRGFSLNVGCSKVVTKNSNQTMLLLLAETRNKSIFHGITKRFKAANCYKLVIL